MPNLFSNYSSDILKINLALRKFEGPGGPALCEIMDLVLDKASEVLLEDPREVGVEKRALGWRFEPSLFS